MREFTIQSNDANQRFDKYLKKLLPNAGSGFLYKMLRKKNITLNGKKAEGTESLKQGDIVKLFLSEETFLKFSVDLTELRREYDMLSSLGLKGLEIVYEDEEMLVANKPYNMLSQKAEVKDVSANERLLGYLIGKGSLTFEDYITFHPSVCNRLDRNTTGLIIMGKSLPALQTISQGLKDRSIHKYYRAVVKGTVYENRKLAGYLHKDEKTNKVTISTRELPDSSYIETAYKSLQRSDRYTLLEIELITGKTHQIRAHLASIGHPIVGDFKYGDEAVNMELRKTCGVNHQLLHAYRLELPDGKIITCQPPALFDRVLEQRG